MEKALLSNRAANIDPKITAIVNGLKEVRNLMDSRVIECDSCVSSPARATELTYTGGKFLKRCRGCSRSNRPAVTRSQPATTRPGSADVRVSRARLEAAERGEFLGSPILANRPILANHPARVPHPAGDSANYRTPKRIPTRWFHIPD